MAGKWAIAKALGRAIVNKSDDNPIKQSARESISKDIDRKFVTGDKDAGDRAAAFNKGYFEGGRASRGRQEPNDYYTNGPKDLDAAESRLDDFTDRATDNELKRDFDEAFDDATERHGHKKWREESKDMPLDDGFGGDMHDVNRMDAEQRVREEMIRDKHTLSDDEFIDKWFNK